MVHYTDPSTSSQPGFDSDLREFPCDFHPAGSKVDTGALGEQAQQEAFRMPYRPSVVSSQRFQGHQPDMWHRKRGSLASGPESWEETVWHAGCLAGPDWGDLWASPSTIQASAMVVWGWVPTSSGKDPMKEGKSDILRELQDVDSDRLWCPQGWTTPHYG